MSLYTKCIPTTILLVPLLFLAYELFKVYKNNMDHPVGPYQDPYLSVAFLRCCSSLLFANAVKFCNSLASISFNLPAIPGNLKSSELPSFVFNLAFIFSSLCVMSLEISVFTTVAKWGSFTNKSSRTVRGQTKHRVATAAHTVT